MLEDRHRRAHPPETEALVERLLPRHRVQQDLAVTAGPVDEPLDHFPAEPGALVRRMHRDVAQVRTVDAVGHGPACGDEPAAVARQALEHAVRERRPQPVGTLVAERRESVQLGQLGPIDVVDGIGPLEIHDDPR